MSFSSFDVHAKRKLFSHDSKYGNDPNGLNCKKTSDFPLLDRKSQILPYIDHNIDPKSADDQFLGAFRKFFQ